MMKKFFSLLLGFGLMLIGQSHAQTQDSFDREFARFDKDFDRLNNWKADTPASKKLKRAPAATANDAAPASTDGTTPLDAEPTQTGHKVDAPADADKSVNEKGLDKAPADKTSGLPKGAKVERLARNDRLGNQISDPEMRKKVQALYRRSDVVVQQYVLPTN